MQSTLFRLSEPMRFLSKVNITKNDNILRALFFNEKYGIVFGQGDLNINFDEIAKSSSKLGQTYTLPDAV
jgi:hypothetical protein